MNKLANFALLGAVAIVAVATEHMFVGPKAVEVKLTSTSVEGEVISVEAAPSVGAERSPPRQALVKLSTGETVRASVPGGCLVFPGQTTRLAKYGDGSKSVYVVTENGRNDS